MDNHNKISKFMSLILRHNPKVINIQLDKNGWASVEELIKGINKAGHKIDMDILEEVVATNNKKRFIFNEDKTKIRANQGHSIDVDVELKVTKPPSSLFHGTAVKYYDTIMKQGLQKRSRNHVHLSDNEETAITVGKRHGQPIVLKIDSKTMYDMGYVFYLSENGVWLTDEVPLQFISE